MNVFECRSLLTFWLTNKLMLITLQATQYNKREMFEFRKLRRLKTNPYVDIKKYNNNNNRNNRKFLLNYDYEDWEKKTPDFYDDMFSKSNVYSTTTTSTISTTLSPLPPTTYTTIGETSSTSEATTSIPTTVKDTTINTIPILNETTTAISTSTENTTTNTVEDITSVTTTFAEPSQTESKPFDTVPISSNTTTSITPEVTTTSVLSPGTVTTSVQDTTTVLTTSSSITTMSPQTTTAEIATSVNTFVTEIKNEKHKLRSGYFSASLVVILRAIADKEPAQLLSLMLGFHGVMMSMISDQEFAFLGTPVVNMFTEVNNLMIQQYPEMVQGVADETAHRLEDRRSQFMPDTNAIMDVVDTIYVEEDVTNIAAVLDHLKRFPATDKTAEDISREGLEAVVFTPWGRIAGDPRQRLLRLELDAAIQQRVPGRPGRRHGVTSKINYSKENLRTSNTMSTITETTFEYQYVKNATIMKRLKKRQSSFLVKMRSIRFSEFKIETRRGPTTTTTTTTVKPTMHKSKYYRMKKVMKNLQRRKNVTKKTTKFRWRYYGEVKKLKEVPYRKYQYYNIQRNRENSCESKNHNITHSTQCSSAEKADFEKTIDSDSDSYYSETDSSYEEKNTTADSNSLETLTRLGKSGEFYKSDCDSKMEDYDKYNQRNSKNNDKRQDIKKAYANKKGFEAKINKYTKSSIRDYVDYKKRKYIGDLKLKEHYTDFYSFGRSIRNRNRFQGSIYKGNRVLRIRNSTKQTQIRHPIVNIKNNKPFTKPNVNRYHKIKIKRNDVKYILLNTKTYNKIRLNDVIWNYFQKNLSSSVANNKYNDRNYRNNGRFNTMKLHRRVFHKLGKNTKFSPKYQTVVSDSIDDERLLKANLEDAMFHREDFRAKMKNRRNLEVKVNKLHQIDSVSDDEVKIKGRIYKVLGLNDDFGKQLRTIH